MPWRERGCSKNWIEAGFARTLAEKNKGGRDDRAWLSPLVVEHLTILRTGFGEFVFPWEHTDRTLYAEFDKIQDSAGVKPEGGRRHFTCHDLRRGFATANEGRVSDSVLQRLMRHKSPKTMQTYVAMAKKMKAAPLHLYQPILRKKGESA